MQINAVIYNQTKMYFFLFHKFYFISVIEVLQFFKRLYQLLFHGLDK